MEEQQKGRSSKKTKKKKKGIQVWSVTQRGFFPPSCSHVELKFKMYKVNTDVGRKNVLKFMEAECKIF